MDYQNYDIEDFVMDLSFQNYCSGVEEDDVIFWKAWIKSNPACHKKVQQAASLFILLNGNNDAQEFRRHEQAFRKAVYKHLDKKDAANKLNAEAIVTSFQKLSKRRILFLYAGGIAASLLIIVIVVFFRNGSQQTTLTATHSPAKTTYTSRPGERKSLQLPDGSVILLNAGTTVMFPPDFNVANREVYLKGEAYFKVTHNAKKPFIIHTNCIDVKVLGTEFNVKAYPEDKTTEALLVRGSVEVTLNDKSREKIILKPNHKVIIQNNVTHATASPDSIVIARKTIPEKMQVMDVMVNATDSTMLETSWIKNRLNFNDETLAEVAIKLERWYGVKISVDGDIAGKYKYSAIFENEAIDEALKALQHSLFFHYRVEDNKIFITK